MKASDQLLFPAVLAGSLLLQVGEVAGYGDHTTHKQLTERTVELAAKDGYGELLDYQAVIANASIAEDADDRALHHFFDPSTGQGLAANTWVESFYKFGGQKARGEVARYMSALDWALEGMRDGRHWRGAIEAYDYTDTSKKRAYDALGHVLHLLQDMGQPDHARNRPHPCSWVRGFLKAHDASFIPIPDRLGYESLWTEEKDWPRGTDPKRFRTLDRAFIDLARESKQAEDALGLPLPGELALGCGPGVFSATPLSPGTHMLDKASIIGEARRLLEGGHPLEAFLDNGWATYELAVPLIPTIPRDPGDPLTRKYLELGRTLLPKVEEYGAGLLRLFYDIVNPPPFVHSVVIRQHGGTTANVIVRGWRDAQPEWRGRVPAREIVANGTNTLDANIEAEVRISFGPLVLDRDRRPKGAPVRDVELWIETAGMPAGAADQCGGGERVTLSQDPADPGTFVGHFIPSRAGTLCINARDRNNHFEGRQHRGDVLDADPATPAKATWPPPYEWTGYEPGVDRNHRFAVRGEAGCNAAGPSAVIAKSMRSGTWTGSIRRHFESKNFDRLMPGHNQPHARVWTTHQGDETFDVTFRALAITNRPSVHPVGIHFGHGTGSFNARGARETRWGSADSAPKREEYDYSGSVSAGGGLRSKQGKVEYWVDLSAFGSDRRLLQGHDARVHGELCEDGGLRGSLVHESGKPDSWFYGRTVTTWSFSFSPTEPPPHFRLVEGLPRAGWLLSGEYRREVEDALRPFLNRVDMPRRHARRTELMKGLDELHYSRASELQRGLDEILHRRIGQLSGRLSELWVSNEADADGKYQQGLAELSEAIKSWQDKKRSVEERYAAATETAATGVERADPDVAKRLRQLAQELRDKGFPTN